MSKSSRSLSIEEYYLMAEEDRSNNQPLHYAAAYGDPDAVAFILREDSIAAGVDIEKYVDVQSACGETPLYLATKHSIDIPKDDLALKAKYLQTITLLLSRGASIYEQSLSLSLGSDNKSPFDLVYEADDEDLMALFVRHLTEDPDSDLESEAESLVLQSDNLDKLSVDLAGQAAAAYSESSYSDGGQE